MTVEHRLTPDGESTEKWALHKEGFIGSIQQLTCCARCGDRLEPKSPSENRRFGLGPVFHILCDPCYDALPD
ncbi:MAG: hypothetical protein CMK96_06380 [Pseudomonas sp.]|nr:hypothetical protein [Pseudomonas sp.]QDP67262.1 MAG: hypothetical protein GOVbin7368_53 [Prokaryotic dsDNA virus sp.]